MTEKKPKITLKGAEKNPFILIQRVRKAMFHMGVDPAEIRRFTAAAGLEEVAKHTTDQTPAHVVRRAIETVKTWCEIV